MQKHVAAGELVLLGVTQEQHAERCQLFAQWKQFDWPILHDPINFLAARGVPLTIAIDEHGVVRNLRPTADWVRQTFLPAQYESPPTAGPTVPRDVPRVRKVARTPESFSFKDWLARGDNAMLWGQDADTDSAIEAYTLAMQLAPGDGPAHFRLGVAYRRRYETASRQPGDFQLAVDHWSKALELDPNQYIWRRRIQQFGPRLTKPYPFYDWVEQAREEIQRRGEQPTSLPVLPSGAEIARPAERFESVTGADKSPDADGKIDRDESELIAISVAVVPAAIKPGEAARIHLDLCPSAFAKWNNEVDPPVMWLEHPQGWELDRGLLRFTDVPQAVESEEIRRMEIEVKAPPTCAPGKYVISGYALYYVCARADGTCLYRRQDIQVPVLVSAD